MRVKKRNIKQPNNKKPTFKKFSTHEDRLIESVFDDGDTVDVKINLSPPENKVDDAYDFVDYGLVAESTIEQWQDHAKSFAAKFHPYVVKVMAAIDASMAINEHFKEAVQADLSIMTKQALSDISSMLEYKLKTLILEDLDFESEEAKAVFEKTILKKEVQQRVVHPIESLSKFFSLDTETDPYATNGAQAPGVALTKTLRG